MLRTLARPMLASMFVAGGIDALRDPSGKAVAAADVTEPVKDAVPALDPATNEELVQLNGVVQVVGGLLLAFGKLPRISALLLAGSLIPTTLAGHRFWEHRDPQLRANHRAHFLKNLGLLGGLILAVLDREGEPSLVWKAEHAVDHARTAADHAGDTALAGTALAGQQVAHTVTRARTAAEHAADRARTALEHTGENLLAGAALAGQQASHTVQQARTAAEHGAEKARATAEHGLERARDNAGHTGDVARLRTELTKKQLTPDVTDAAALVRRIRGARAA